MAKSKLEKKAATFNKKFKVGSTIKFKDAFGKTQTGTLKHSASAQKTQVSIWIEESKGKISLDSVTSK